MEQQRALNALEPFLVLSKSATSPRAAADLITQATSAPHTYIFAELLQKPTIQSLRSTEHEPSLKLLEIFAWGTHADYTSAAPALPQVNDSQTLKLRLLSLLPLLTHPPANNPDPSANLTYPYLQKHLSLPNPLALERLLTTALSSGLITGHLDPLHRRVAVTSVAPLRDLPPNSIGSLTHTLTQWEERCDTTLSEIDSHIQEIRDNARVRGERDTQRKVEFESKMADYVQSASDEGGGSGKGGWALRNLAWNAKAGGKRTLGEGYSGDGAMDVDEGGAGRGKGSRKLFARMGGGSGR